MRGLFSILVHLPQYLRLAWRLMWDARTPGKLKLWVILAILYGLVPIDFIPEGLLLHLGLGEDIIFLVLSVRNLIVHSPPNIVTEHARAIARKKT
jgi:uncharacterized membrane protein YkvA (DUF1232 family)